MCTSFKYKCVDSIKILNLSNNSLYGNVRFWGQIYRFEKVDLSNNRFSGDIDLGEFDVRSNEENGSRRRLFSWNNTNYNHTIDFASTSTPRTSTNTVTAANTRVSANNPSETPSYVYCQCDTPANTTATQAAVESTFTTTLRELYLNNNNWDEQAITWSDFSNYPNLEKLDLSNNKFSGTIDVRNLANLVYLNVENNQFTEIYDFNSWDNLDDLNELYMSNKTIREDLDLSSLPPSLKILKCHNNEFTGTLAMTSMPKSLITFDCGDNSFEDLSWQAARNVADGDEYALGCLCMLFCFYHFCFGACCVILYVFFVFVVILFYRFTKFWFRWCVGNGCIRHRWSISICSCGGCDQQFKIEH